MDIEIKVRVNIKDSVLQDVDKDCVKDELAGVINSSLSQYILQECIGYNNEGNFLITLS